MVDEARTDGFYNRSLERALQILNSFNPERLTYTLVQLSRTLNLSKATTLRLCTTLLKYDYLIFNSETKQYSLGLKVFELGSLVFSSLSLRRIAAPYLSKLQIKIGKTVFLGILRDEQLVYIDKKEDPSNHIRFASGIGQRRPPIFGMMGQLLLAYLPKRELDELLERHPLKAFTKRSITNIDLFRERLEAIRSQGYFVDKEEAIDGATGIAAPIRDFSGRVVAALGIGFLTISEHERGIERMIRDAKKTASAISMAMGFMEPGNEKNASIY